MTTQFEKMDSTPIQKFYEGKSIFLTGATGFVGKILLEKLLRSCPGITRIYLLLREKKGQTGSKRLDDLFSSSLYSLLRKTQPNFQEKISIVSGDLTSPTLDISAADHVKLQNDVNVIFHAAGRVQWDNKLKIYVQVHMIATGVLLEMAKKFKHMEAFVYVSTAYVHQDPDLTVPERVVKKHVTPKQILDSVEWMDEETARSLVRPLTVKHNLIAYTLSKALTENILEDNHGHLPVAIVRLVYVTPAYKEPIPGFCDVFQMVQGITIGLFKGIIRCFYIPPNTRANVIPVDIAANTLIATAWHLAQVKEKEEVLVVNCAFEDEKRPLVDKSFIDSCWSLIKKYPLANIVRYPDLTIHTSLFWFKIHHFFSHYLLIVLADVFLYIFTGKPWMLRLHNFAMKMFMSTYLTIAQNPFICKLGNYKAIQKQLSNGDEKLFSMDTDNINIPKYVEDCVIVMREHLGKEDLSNLTYARRKHMIWWFVTSVLKWTIILYVLYRIYFFIFT